MTLRLIGCIALALSSIGCEPLTGETLGEQCDLNSSCEAPLVCRMSRCRRECATDRDCPIGSRCVLDEQGLGACLLGDEDPCASTDDCPAPLVCAAESCVNECDDERRCPPGSRCNAEGVCGDEQGDTCERDSDCATGQRCGPDGRCRRQCFDDRDCAFGAWCSSGVCLRFDGGAASAMDAGLDAGMDAGSLDGAAIASDAGPIDAGPVFCADGGGCDPAPAATVGCTSGVCAVESCEAPFLDCDGDVRNGCEANPEANRLHCGGCGMPCGAGEVCLASTCVTATIRDVQASTSTCALWSTGHVTCWGSNISGGLGDGTTTHRPVPVMVSGVTDAQALAVGGGFACVLHPGGTVSCWGGNNRGELGNGGAPTASSTPVAVSGLTDAVGITAGGQHACARRTGGEAVCWGHNGFGQLGDGTTSFTATDVPVAVSTLAGVTQLVAGSFHTCAIDGAMGTQCWGRAGQVGDGDTSTSNLTPGPVTLSGGVSFASLAAGGTHTFGITADGRAYCWGSNTNQECALSSFETNIDTPREVPRLSSVRTMTGRCAIFDDGSLRCWGKNDWGQAGLGHLEGPIDRPESVPVSDVAQVATGAHTCVVLGSGALRCLGHDGSGQLGDGVPSSDAQLTFQPVLGLP